MQSLKKAGKSQFQILMQETSDQIQALAMAYGERITIEACQAFLKKLSNAENKRVMTIAFQVYAIDVVKNDLGFFMVHKTVSKDAAKHMIAHQNELIKELSKHINPIMESFNVPFDSLHVPIAQDY